MASQSAYLTALCSNESCRLRFPATPEEFAGLRCPLCGGTLATVPRPTADDAPHSDTFAPQTPRSNAPLVGVLDNIRSIHNTGSMFRTADGAGLSHLYLCGITATPDQPRLAKTALGSEKTVPWSTHLNGVELVASLHKEGYVVVALERISGSQSQQSLLDKWRVPPARPVALIVGNERAGVDPALLLYCDQVMQLPMAGRKSSLNAAVAFGIAAYHLRFGQPLEG